MEKEYTVLTELCRCFLHGEEYEMPKDTNFNLLYSLAKSHNLTGVCHCALQNAKNKKVLPQEILSDMQNDFLDIVFLNERQSRVFDNLESVLSSSQTPYIAFKGIALRELYPVPESRAMGDIDIIIRPKSRDYVKSLLISDGFKCEAQNGPVYNYSKNGVLAEIHTQLLREFNCNAFNNPFEHARFDGQFGTFDDNYHFAYLIAHTAHHFKFRGAGIKHILDLAVMLQKKDIDLEKAFEYLDEAGLRKFSEVILSVCFKWFGVGRLYTDDTAKTEKYLFTCGAFGAAVKNKGISLARKELEQGRRYSPFMMKLRLLFPSYSKLRQIDYIKGIDGRPWLVPYAWCYRIIYNLKNRREFVAAGVSSLNDDETKALAYDELEFFKEIGL